MPNPQHRLETAAARLLLGLSRRLGPRRASDCGGWIARTIGPLLPVSRIARRNLARALPLLPAAERDRVVRAMWDNLGRTVAELPHLPVLEWEMVGREHLVPLMEHGGPAILVSGHIGNWEVLPPALATLGIRMGSVYRAADNDAVDRLIRECRAAAVEGEPLPLFPKGSTGARAALRYLSGGGVLGMLADQKLNDGIAAPLLGLSAMTAPAPAQLALRFGCPIIPGHVERLGPCRFRLVVEPPLPVPPGPDRQVQILALTTAINDRLSAWITERPAEWLWLHRRWPE
ncbi:lauroyl acyltransferase [Belnapia sp. T6]|uniref:Lauroyl acyltransferase n=1 Tax=Belnapia mucosa TaxID=2804532 RepID=A0ABS1UZP3_9PROT|nr:lauroyl acyltransferase [Belnapia mucosa]MBL6454922.1 lauroyl acyltransferase [Belnapia mucosa]